jgi:Domain of unknown function (DUF1906)
MTVDKPRSKWSSWRRFATVTVVAAVAVPVVTAYASGGASAGRDPAGQGPAGRVAAERDPGGGGAGVTAAADSTASGDLAASGKNASLKKVSYRGYTFEVPRSWRVIDLASGGQTCVRFDHHVIYLGQPPRNESCPSLLVGATEAVLVQPGLSSSASSSVEDPVAKLITVTAPRIQITATYDGHRAQISRILASASMPAPVIDTPNPTRAATRVRAPLSVKVANYHGLGFDACTAPSASYLNTWRQQSPYRAIGVYIGGSNRACAQPNLTAAWIRAEAADGWHFLPMYVGPQAEFGQLTSRPGRQGRAAANDAVMQAERLGFGPGTPLYYDMEAYAPAQTYDALTFLSAWTSRLHALGYSSGVYGSSGAGIGYLANRYHSKKYVMPDVIFDALWNGERNTNDAVFGYSEWTDHHRVHQFAGNVVQSYGGDTIEIDQDFLNVKVRAPASSARHAKPTPVRIDGS